MSGKKSSESRRKLLKSIAAGSGAVVAGKSLPDSWNRPAVDSVMLPAHAQTSLAQLSGAVSLQGAQHDSQRDSLFANTLDAVIPPAEAQLRDVTLELCITPIDQNSANVLAYLKETIGPDCFTSILYSASNVPVGVQTPFQTLQFGCDEANLMDHFGLVNKAHAGISVPADSWIRLDSIVGSGLGSVYVADFGAWISENFVIPQNQCPGYPSGCCQPSDMRLKTNIEALSISREGFNLYKFQYLDEDNENTYVGVMAQDIISSHPDAVLQNESGFYMVRYDQLGLKMVTLDQWISEGPDCVELVH